MSVFSQESTHSVGSRLAVGRVVSSDSARISLLNAKLAVSVREIANKELSRMTVAKKVVLPFQVTPGFFSELSDSYREFSIKQVPVSQPVHVELESHRALALSYAEDFCSKYGDSRIVLGNTLLNNAINDQRMAHVEMAANDAVAVHANHSAALAYSKMARASDDLRIVHDVDIKPEAYDSFRKGHAFQVCTEPDCKASAPCYVADGSMYPLSCDQFCSGMLRAKSKIGVMLVPYHPEMFRESSGVIPGIGVGYKMLPKTLQLMYPEGTAGATRWDMSSWVQWLTSSVHTFTKGVTSHRFMIELRGHRGCFLFATVVHLPDGVPLPSARLTHALELKWPRDMLVCRFKELRGLGVDPMVDSSWVDVVGYYPRAVCMELYHHALALPRERYTWEALLKRALVADGRVTYQGSSVRLQQALTSKDAHRLTMLIYSRVFVDRFKMGKLAADMMRELKGLSAFGAASVAQRVYMVMAAIGSNVYSKTVGAVATGVKSLLDSLVSMFTRKLVLGSVVFEDAPAFVTYESYAAGLVKYWSFMQAVRGGHVTVPGVRGDVEAWKIFGGPGESSFSRVFKHPVMKTRASTGVFVEEVVDMSESGIVTEEASELVDEVADLNQMGRALFDRFLVRKFEVTPEVKQTYGPPGFVHDPGYVNTINAIHEAMFPGMARQDFEIDGRSLAIGGQDRAMHADGLKVPLYGTLDAGETKVYKSKLLTYNTQKRAQNASELLSALAARTLAAPVVSTAQDDANLIPKVWDNFLDMACVPDARDRLVKYKADPVGLERELFAEWTKKARPDALKKMLGVLAKDARSLEEMDISQYLVQLKSDAKPPMSDKPMREQPAPQVIVYHEKVLSALYSSIFRVLVRRFLSLLKPEWMINLLKDGNGIRDHIAACHPWGKEGLKYLENDFGKFDKSQHEFAFKLEFFVFSQLGMSQMLLDRWFEGHDRCTLRSVSLGISLHVDWQRKSGDATTAFGNVILNVLSVCYAYRGSEVEWAVFMGDDSLVCCSVTVATPRSLEVLAQVFNLQAKFIVSNFPYFASGFILFDAENKQVRIAPDPVKRVQRWAVSLPFIDPGWEDRYRSQFETCEVYMHSQALAGLAESVAFRYNVPVGVTVEPLFDAIATLVSDFDCYRASYEREAVVVYRRH